MITLPLECFLMIFFILYDNFLYNDLFSCALVNRLWCRIIVPILWRDPSFHFVDPRLIRTFLLTLNVEEQTLLIPFNISLPSRPKPLFDYTSYITSIDSWLYYEEVSNWLNHERHHRGFELENAVRCSLIAMILRTSKYLKHIYINELICNQLIFENLYEQTNVTSVNFDFKNNIDDDIKSKSIDQLIKFLNRIPNLTSLEFSKIGPKGTKTLLKALYEYTVLNSLCLYDNSIGIEEAKILEKFLYKNTTLTLLNLSYNNLGSEGGKILARGICKNTSLISLNLCMNNLGSEGGKALADIICKNTTLVFLDLSSNNLGSEGGKVLADAIYKNTTLVSLNLYNNKLGTEGGKALANALYKNTSLKDLNLDYNDIGPEGGKAFADALCKNITLTSLDIEANNINFKICSNNQRLVIRQENKTET
ncbi:hypothetical protein C2G38_2182316 [Gigaspora rosea]|uniref:F-box domain-containing protein n=1 Tax=Gigaspora rosea TaxID=44941 RepID=A0A397VE90_9GLOM|nr:hypothetical protein C2G38_2182316 [Gigaspora rosea]